MNNKEAARRRFVRYATHELEAADSRARRGNAGEGMAHPSDCDALLGEHSAMPSRIVLKLVLSQTFIAGQPGLC